MRYFIIFIAGFIFVGIVTVVVFIKSESEKGIQISIKNDTSQEIEKVFFITSNKQEFSCTLLYNQCRLALLNVGDISIKVQASTKSGKELHGLIGYADSSSQHSINISELSSVEISN